MIPLAKKRTSRAPHKTPRLRKVLLPNRQNAFMDRDALEIPSVSIDYGKVYNEKPAWKEGVDLFFGTIGMIIFLVLYPFIVLAIKCSSNGPAIFRQERTGFDGRIFTCYKFRTMHYLRQTSGRHRPDITYENDTRIFKVGQFLRKTNLDELPQFINVLKGDMSVVGPRPYPVRENSYWNSTFPDFYKRFSVKPGLTGLAQAHGFRGGTLNLLHMRERLKRDLIYIKKRSLSMDLKVILLTIRSMLTLDTKAH